MDLGRRFPGAVLLLLAACAGPPSRTPAPSEPAQPPTPARDSTAAKTAPEPQPTLEMRCDRDELETCAELGRQHRFGVRADLVRARELFERSCAEGDGDRSGCYGLAELCLGGIGGPREELRAIELLEGGCTAKHLDSCSFLGLIYVEGLANPTIPYDSESREHGRALWKDACDAGHERSCERLSSH